MCVGVCGRVPIIPITTPVHKADLQARDAAVALHGKQEAGAFAPFVFERPAARRSSFSEQSWRVWCGW